VTLPQLRAAAAFVTVMLVIGGFNVFISVFLMTGGGPAHQTETVLSYLYNQAFTFLDFGYGSAIAYLLMVLIFVLSLVQMKLFRYGEEDQ
jgi:multiple sugar transport system permease protein